jgi:hypothetical protein
MDVYSTASRSDASAGGAGDDIVACVRTRNRAAVLALAGTLIAAPATVSAATPLPKPSSPLLWATIDVCATAAHPDTIGIRGSMPGTGDGHERMFMQFVVEYRGRSGRWRYLSGGESGTVAVGAGSAASRQAGWDFSVAPSSTETYRLRGVVVFEWRLKGRTVAQQARATRSGHGPTVGADPAGYSAATCTIGRSAARRA